MQGAGNRLGSGKLENAGRAAPPPSPPAYRKAELPYMHPVIYTFLPCGTSPPHDPLARMHPFSMAWILPQETPAAPQAKPQRSTCPAPPTVGPDWPKCRSTRDREFRESSNILFFIMKAAVEAAFAARTAVAGGGDKLNSSFKPPGLMQSLRDERRLQDSCSTSNL